MKPVAIVQARLGSRRLPGKVLAEIAGHPMIWHIVARLRSVPGIARVVVATSDLGTDAPLRDFCASAGIEVHTGSETDVLDRFYRAAVAEGADPVIRVTGDCPLIDPGLVTRVVETFASGDYDHVSVAAGAGAAGMLKGRFPSGTDTECFSFASLSDAWREATHALDREHVTPFIWRNDERFRCRMLTADRGFPSYRLTVDTQEDLDLVRAVYDALYSPDRAFGLDDVADFLDARPDLVAMNRMHEGREGHEAVWSIPRGGK